MATIPQFTRDQIVSPVVGTPGIDTSAADSASAVSTGAEKVASLAFDQAIKVQQSKDVAEANTLMTQYKINTINTLEQHKLDYADNPDQSGPAFVQAMSDNMQDIEKQAGNARVKMMVGKGDPYFDAHMAMQQGAWASQQSYNNVKNQAIQDTQKLGISAGLIGENSALTFDQQKEQLKPLLSALDNTVASLKASKRSDLADEVGIKGAESLYKGLFYGALKNDPVKAFQILDDPDFKNAVPAEDIEKFASAAKEGITSFNKTLQWQQTASEITKYPDVINQVRDGKLGWGDLDQMQRQQGSGPGLSQATYTFLKDTAMKMYPEESVAEQSHTAVQFYDEAHKLGFDVPKGKPSENVRALTKFNEDLMSARARGVISAEKFNAINDKLATPLAGAVLHAHDPNWFDRLKQVPQSIWSKMNGNPQDALDRYNEGYGAIDNYLTKTGVDKSSAYFKTKSALLEQYFKVADQKLGNPQYQNSEGRPYTAVDVAHEVMGIAMGQMVKTPFGMRKVNGYKSPGVPTVETTKEDDELLKGPVLAMAKKGP